MANLKEVDFISEKTVSLTINPTTMMMVAMLYEVEKKLDDIMEMQKQILAFLEREKKAEIEADVKTLFDLINKYKFNWDNELFLSSSHKMVLDIQRTARKNMISYQMELTELVSSNKLIFKQSQIDSKLQELQDKFNYYRLSLYSYSLASQLEIMLSGNFNEEYVSKIKYEIEDLSMSYRQLLSKTSVYIEEMSRSSLNVNVLKGIGVVSEGMGNIIGAIPVIREGQVDEFSQDSGQSLKNNVKERQIDIVKTFSDISSPGTKGIIDQMNNIIHIYNNTSHIYFDNENIYLAAS